FRNKLGVFATASAVAYLFLVRAMPRGLQFSIFVILCVALSAFKAGNDHNLMNASSGPIVLDIRSSRDQPITHFRLSSGHSVDFNGVCAPDVVRMVSGKMLTFSERQLIQLHGASVPTRGGWLVEDSGVRSV